MIDVFVIRRFYGTEGNNEERAMKSVGRRKRERGKEGKRAAPVFMKPKAQ